MEGGRALTVAVRKRLGDFQLDAAFTAPEAGVTTLFGPSGAGKSQTLAAVAGAVRPDMGRVTLGAQVLFDSAASVDLKMERRRIGWVFQDGRLFPHLSVDANLDYGARRARGRDAGVRRADVVEMLGLQSLLQRRPHGLSGGERQRVAIGRALLSQPALLLMDEPLAALDLARRAEILPYLARLKGAYRLPILYVTHALSEVAYFADHLVLMEAGKVIAEGPLAEVLSREDLPQLAFRPDAGVVLDAVVAGHDAARGLTRLAAGGAVLLVPKLPLAVGDAVRALALARDVLLATEWPLGLSARNVLPGRVEAVAEPRPDGVVLVRVGLVDGPSLLSAVTGDAVEALALARGRPVLAVVKSVAVESLGSGAPPLTLEG